MSKIIDVKEEGKCLLYDPYTKQYFHMTIDEAEAHVNSNPEIYTGDFVSSVIQTIKGAVPCLTMQIKEGLNETKSNNI